MNLLLFIPARPRVLASLAALAIGSNGLAGFGSSAFAAHTGPVPAPTDAFGGPGSYSVVTATLPSPDWPGQEVTVFLPDGAPGRRPVWCFAHGFAGTDPEYYGELLRHLASHGAIVVFSPYPAAPLQVAENYATLFDGFVAAVARFADRIDTTRVGFAGHSYGAGAVPALALRAVRERGWGGNGLALLLLAPWYSYGVSDQDLASFPAGTQAVVQVYEDDLMNDHRMAIDVFTHLGLPAADKDFLMVRSDRIDGYNYDASHRTPTGVATPAGSFDALDTWGVHRIAQALAASTFDRDAAGRLVALGHGSPEQTAMGTLATGRALRPMAESASPVPLFPSGRFRQPWDSRLNPRVGAALPTPSTAPRLLNLSARATSGVGDDVLIVGAVVSGRRPKSLLIRAVGPGLAAQGVTDAMANPQLLTFRHGDLDVRIDDWADAPDPDALQVATQEVGALTLADGSADAALLASFPSGAITVHAPSSEAVPGNAMIELYDADEDASSQLVNLSARARVKGANDVLIAGFVTAGGNVRVLLRGVGPALRSLGVGDALANPVIELYHRGDRIAANDDWSGEATQAADVAAAASRVGAFALPNGSADASLLVTLPAGAYTVHVRSADGAAGVALAEIYLVP